MNEEQKNIETCLAENILSEVANVPTDTQFRSLVEESFDPLQQQALQQAGYDGYKEVVMYHQPYTFTSQVKQMKSNLILLLRRLWRYPFGRGTTTSSDAGSASASAAAPIRSLADMWQHYITRLKGNPEYGIPSRLSQLTDLPSAPLLVADRKISGVPEAADGISMVHLLCDALAAATVTEITDNNEPWEYKLGSLPTIRSIFPNASNISLNVDAIIISEDHNETRFVGYSSVRAPYMRAFAKNTPTNYDGGIGFRDCTFYEIEMPALKAFGTGYNRGVTLAFFDNCQNLETVYFPEAEYAGVFITSTTNFAPRGYNTAPMFNNCPNIKNVLMPKCKRLGFGSVASGAIEKLELGVMEGMAIGIRFDASLELIILHGAVGSLDFSKWSPTTSLSDNLQQFLSNFKTYIAERLTDKGTGLTLTLSQEVRNAIHAAEDEYGIENIIITQKGWTISPAPN